MSENLSAVEKKNRRLMLCYIFAWSIAFLAACPVAMLVNGEQSMIFADFFRIITSPSKLVTDYFMIGGLSSTLLNAGLCGLFCCLIIVLVGAKPDGKVIAGYFLVIAHCFYGLNFVNMWPTFIGVAVFCAVTKRRFADHVHIAMFATSLGPFISDFLFRYTLGDKYVFGEPKITVSGVILALCFGIFAGFIVPALLPGTTKMHRGFNLYKAGLAIGLFGTFVYAFMYKTLGITPPEPPTRVNPVYEAHGCSYGAFMVTFFLIMFIGSVAAGFIINGKSFRGYNGLFRDDGHDVDFTEKFGAEKCFINYGIYGFCIIAYVGIIVIFTSGVGFTGATCGVIIAALTFAAAGQTPKNVWPIVLGYSLLYVLCIGITRVCSLPMAWSLSTQGYINGLAFATGLCPFSGKYGWKIGTLAGFIDAIICTSTVAMHGGFVLYNGGFAAGLSALILVPMLDYYCAEEIL